MTPNDPFTWVIAISVFLVSISVCSGYVVVMWLGIQEIRKNNLSDRRAKSLVSSDILDDEPPFSPCTMTSQQIADTEDD